MTHYETVYSIQTIKLKDLRTKEDYNLIITTKVELLKDNCRLIVNEGQHTYSGEKNNKGEL